MGIRHRQLLRLSKAPLNYFRKSVLCESTSVADMETDKIIQETVETVSKYYTILTIVRGIDIVVPFNGNKSINWCIFAKEWVSERVSTITLSLSRGLVKVYTSTSLVFVFNVFLLCGGYHYFFSSPNISEASTPKDFKINT